MTSNSIFGKVVEHVGPNFVQVCSGSLLLVALYVLLEDSFTKYINSFQNPEMVYVASVILVLSGTFISFVLSQGLKTILNHWKSGSDLRKYKKVFEYEDSDIREEIFQKVFLDKGEFKIMESDVEHFSSMIVNDIIDVRLSSDFNRDGEAMYMASVNSNFSYFLKINSNFVRDYVRPGIKCKHISKKFKRWYQ